MKGTRRGGPRAGGATGATRDAIFGAAADLFSRRGFDGVTVDEIAKAAGVNRAMLYYHFTDKLTLYRDVVLTLLTGLAGRANAIAAEPISPEEKLQRFIGGFVTVATAHPYLPPLMLREIAEGALHFDLEILTRMRSIFSAFAQMLTEGQQVGAFRQVNPVLAYMSVLGPLLLNAARERAAQQPGRGQLPMFVQVPHDELAAHMQQAAVRMLKRD